MTAPPRRWRSPRPVAAGFALTLAVFYPGYMTNDAVYVYQFARRARSATGSRR